MRLKFQVALCLFALAVLLGTGGFVANFVYAVIAGIVLAILGFNVLLFADKKDTSLIDGIFFSLI